MVERAPSRKALVATIVALIAASVLINLWGVTWILRFALVPGGLNGWTWVSY